MQPRDTRAEKILALEQKNPNIPNGLPGECLKAIFESSKTHGFFTTYFDEEFYRYAINYYENHIYGRFRYLYAIVGIAKVLENVEISQRNYLQYQDLKRFIEQDFATIYDDENKAFSRFSQYFTSRIDISLVPRTADGDFQIFFVSDDHAKVTKPPWLNNNSVGYMLTSCIGYLEFTTKATVDGLIHLSLKGLDIRVPDDRSKRIPYWIDYTKLIVNEKVIFDKLTPAWHDKSYYYGMNVKAGEEVKIQVEWLPHRSDT